MKQREIAKKYNVSISTLKRFLTNIKINLGTLADMVYASD